MLFVMVMRRIHLTDEDLSMAEQACRSLAQRHIDDAAKQSNPILRDGALNESARFLRLAERIAQFRR